MIRHAARRFDADMLYAPPLPPCRYLMPPMRATRYADLRAATDAMRAAAPLIF